MMIVDIQYAKIHLSTLVDRAVKGEQFVIANAGKALVRVTALDSPKRLGFLAGEIHVPQDFDTMGADQIAAEFASRAENR